MARRVVSHGLVEAVIVAFVKGFAVDDSANSGVVNHTGFDVRHLTTFMSVGCIIRVRLIPGVQQEFCSN